MMSLNFFTAVILSLSVNSFTSKTGEYLVVKPEIYERALRNPLKGFTTRRIYDHPWATTAQTYIRWNEIENQESDGIEKIKKFCDEKWAGVEEKNIKVIPRVYLHWSGARHALLPDAEDAAHDNARINSLRGSFLAGAWGNEFYFGYDHPHSDLTCQDFRSRDLFWNQCKYLLDFFEENKIDIAETENQTNLVQKGDYCFANPGKMHIVFLRNGSGTINLEGIEGEFSVKWFDPRNGGVLQNGTLKNIEAGKMQEIKGAPSEPEKDWVVYLRTI